MKIGSLVELVDDNWQEPEHRESIRLFGFIFPVKKVIYTVREIEEDMGVCILLEEIVNRKILFDDNKISEPSFPIEHFRELQPPMKKEIEALLEEPELV